MGIPQPVHESGQFAVELKIRQCGQLLSQVLQTANHIESIQRSFERQVRIDARENLRKRIDDIQALAPRKRGRLHSFEYRSA
jgi:hypothetical protein